MQQRAEAGRPDLRREWVSKRAREQVGKRGRVREREEGGRGETRSSLCTDLLSREHFNYSTLLTKFQL